MQKIKITCDRTVDLAEDYLFSNNIDAIPLYIVLDEKIYRDGIDIYPEDIYSFVEKTGKLPKTAAASIQDYLDLFSKYQNYDAIIHISLGEQFSSSYQNAKLASNEFDNVYVINSDNLSTGSGQIVMESVQLVNQGLEIDEIVNKLTELVSKVEASFVIDTLDYLKMGGRCSALAAFSANLLNIKPSIEVINGKMDVVKKYRGRFEKSIEKYVVDRLKDRTDIVLDRIFITHSGCRDEIIQHVKDLVNEYQHFDEVIITKASCTISSHCGPNTLGVLFKRK